MYAEFSGGFATVSAVTNPGPPIHALGIGLPDLLAAITEDFGHGGHYSVRERVQPAKTPSPRDH
jgi:hypothetical protein